MTLSSHSSSSCTSLIPAAAARQSHDDDGGGPCEQQWPSFVSYSDTTISVTLVNRFHCDSHNPLRDFPPTATEAYPFDLRSYLNRAGCRCGRISHERARSTALGLCFKLCNCRGYSMTAKRLWICPCDMNQRQRWQLSKR